MTRKAVLLSLLMLAASAPALAYPAKWCGRYARQHLVDRDPGPDYDLACNWLNYGSSTYARQGAMVVWCTRRHHHVGKITGPCNGDRCVVTSGNDGGAVRTRERSVAGASFRM